MLFRNTGDVGYEPEDVERNMGKHFRLANRWGCVLLLDEADVFLAKRNVRLTDMFPTSNPGRLTGIDRKPMSNATGWFPVRIPGLHSPPLLM